MRTCLLKGLLVLCFLIPAIQGKGQENHFAQIDLPHKPNTLVIKTTSPVSLTSKKGLGTRLGISGLEDEAIESIGQTLPWTTSASGSGRYGTHPLATVYTVTLKEGSDLAEVIGILSRSDMVEYAEPYYTYRPLLIPDDPKTGDQQYLSIIRAFEAWNLEQGDSSITIAMLDTGLDYQHEDIRQSVQINHDDPVNGIDDDGDGLVDNYYGWDLANNDNIPRDDTDGHGTTVAGVSSATVNNGTGIAGIGFRTRVLPIKMFLSGSNIFFRGYEAIALAADLGCQVINLSWGEAGAYSAFGEDIIRYAVLEKDVAIIAAAGNTNANLDFYPASMPYVLSVGSTGNNDIKAPWATYSPYIDIMAPGVGITTTASNGSYVATSGSSVSAPMVAAAVALVRARHPELNALQAMEKVRVNADNIDNLQASTLWHNLTGKGRLNIFRALSNITSPSIRVTKFNYDNGIGKQAYYKDTLTLTMEFQNYLYPASGIDIEVASASPYVSFLKNKYRITSLNSLEKKTNSDEPFRIVLAPDTPANHRILLKINFSSGQYTDQQYLEFTTSKSWVTLKNDLVELSVSGNGNVGYVDDYKSNGIGMRYQGNTLLENAGLLVRSGDIVMDNIVVRASPYLRESDFQGVRALRPSEVNSADHYFTSSFKVKQGGSLPLHIEQKTIAWNGIPAVVLEYLITNTSDSTIQGIQPAFFTNFDLNNSTTNRLEVSNDGRMQLTYDAGRTVFAGMEILNTSQAFHTALDLRNLDGNSSDLPSYLTDKDKLGLFDLKKDKAGMEGAGNDVAGSAGLSKTNLLPGATIRFTVVLTSSGDYDMLMAVHDAVRENYARFLENPPVGHIARYCPGSDAVIDPVGSFSRIYKDVGLTELVYEGDKYILPAPSGKVKYYGVDLVSGILSDVYTINVVPAAMDPDFTMSQDTLYLDENSGTKIGFRDRSDDAIAWKWTFSNGYSSTSQHPSVNFPDPGRYTVSLMAENSQGCSGNRVKELLVVRRNPRPEPMSYSICAGESLVIDPAGYDSLHFYHDTSLTSAFYRGSSFAVSGLQKDTLFYITNMDGPWESLPAAVNITVSQVSAGFSAIPDTVVNASKNLLRVRAQDTQAFLSWEMDAEGTVATLGSEVELLIDYSNKTAFTISLTAVNAKGCTSTYEKTFIPAKSPDPVIPLQNVCQGTDVTINPGNGEFYIFYSDPELTNEIYRGPTYRFQQVMKDTIVYVTNNSSLLESNAVPAVVNVSEVVAAFDLPQPAGTSVPIVLSDQSTGDVVERTWFVNEVIAGNENPIELAFPEPGLYDIRLEVSDKFGCTSIVSKTLQAVIITSTETFGESGLPYPNPAIEVIRIPGTPAKLQLISRDGKLLRNCNGCTELLLEGVLPGIYILRQIRSNQTVQTVIMIE